MRNPVKIVTNKIDGYKFVVNLFDEESQMNERINILTQSDNTEILFYGKTDDAFNLNGTLKVGTNVKFYYEQQWYDGKVTSLDGFPYIEVSPDKKPDWRFSLNKKFITTKEATTKYILDNFIVKLSDNKFKKYDLGIVKNESKFFRTPEASLRDLFKKGKFVILLKQK